MLLFIQILISLKKLIKIINIKKNFNYSITKTIMKRRHSNSDSDNGYYQAQKRRRLSNHVIPDEEERVDGITNEFIDKCKTEFNSNPANIIARNAVTTVGPFYASVNAEEENKISHIFNNSIKPFHLRATNQGHSGRCWMFAGLNILRYMVIHATDSKDFEFSESYLFFWDKFERSNTLLQWYIDHPEAEPSDRICEIFQKDYLEDGGYWNYFSNLVKKYGLVPKSAMNETAGSLWTGGMKQILLDRIMACIVQIRNKQSDGKSTYQDITTLKKECLQQIYEALVKLLGQPPETFDWTYQTSDGLPCEVSGLTPSVFRNLVLSFFSPVVLHESGIGPITMDDFVLLFNIPHKDRPFNKMYEVKNCLNVQGGQNCKGLNLTSNDLRKYAKKSIQAGLPVWFAGDVSRGLCHENAALNEKLFDTDLLFGKPYKTTKEEKIMFNRTEGNHAMTLTGYHPDKNGKPVRWQVENSWGYYDNELPGFDGFLSMDNDWFEKDLVQIVVHKSLLSRTDKKKLDQEPIQLEMWDIFAPALKIISKTPFDKRMKKNPRGNFRGRHV